MIVHARQTVYVIVELDSVDVRRLLNGDFILKESTADNSDDVLVRVYCANLQDAK
jgi:hypothetical protein